MQRLNFLGDDGDNLDRRRAGADNADALAREVDALMRPVIGMKGWPLEIIDAGKQRQRRLREETERHNNEAAGQPPPVTHTQVPEIGVRVEMRRFNLAVELHVIAQIELVGDEVEIAQILRLAGEALLPVPFLEDFPREGIAVGVTLGIEAASGVTVVVPGAAKIGAALEQRCRYARVDEPLDLVDAGDAS